jgi:tellurite resistance protein
MDGTTRLPLGTWAIAFGLAGLAEVWAAATDGLGLPVGVAPTVWVVAAVAWVVLAGWHAVRGRRSGVPVTVQLTDPVQGPLAALAPVTAMLLGAELHTVAPLAGMVVVVTAVVVEAAFVGWLVGRWLTGHVRVEAVHGGYLIPSVAGGLVAADTAGAVGLPALGWACFGVGLVFGAVLLTAVGARLALRPPLPAALVPSISIVMAPPAVAGIAWLQLTGGRTGPFLDALAGCTAVLVLVQLGLLPHYRRTAFTLGAWSFTFPTAAVCTFAIEYAEAAGGGGAAPAAVAVLAVVVSTGLVVAVATRSWHPRRSRSAPDSAGRLLEGAAGS